MSVCHLHDWQVSVNATQVDTGSEYLRAARYRALNGLGDTVRQSFRVKAVRVQLSQLLWAWAEHVDNLTFRASGWVGGGEMMSAGCLDREVEVQTKPHMTNNHKAALLARLGMRATGSDDQPH